MSNREPRYCDQCGSRFVIGPWLQRGFTAWCSKRCAILGGGIPMPDPDKAKYVRVNATLRKIEARPTRHSKRDH